jgi:hypothetical protein
VYRCFIVATVKALKVVKEKKDVQKSAKKKKKFGYLAKKEVERDEKLKESMKKLKVSTIADKLKTLDSDDSFSSLPSV